MKKIFIVMAAAAAMVSCGKSSDHYFVDYENTTTNNVNGEFDSLAYAVGMNFGMSAKFQYSALEIPMDELCAVIDEHLDQRLFKAEDIADNHDLMVEFVNTRLNPYMIAKRSAAMRGVDPDSVELPEIFGGEFSSERVIEIMGADMANDIIKRAMPINMHYVYEAMRDAAELENQMHAEINMQLSPSQMMDQVGRWMTAESHSRSAENSERWLKSIATKPDVEMLIAEGDTLYYRVNHRGSAVHPTNINDTVTIEYAIYNYRGLLVESTASRAEMLDELIEQTRNNADMPDSLRDVRIASYEAQRPQVVRPTLPISRLMVNGAKYALEKVGVSGSITVWMPASMAFGTRGNTLVMPNEAVVMDITLFDVKHYDPTAAAVPAPGQVNIQRIPVTAPGRLPITPVRPAEEQ